MASADYQDYVNENGEPLTLQDGSTLRAIRDEPPAMSSASPGVGEGTILSRTTFIFGPDAAGKVTVNSILRDRFDVEHTVIKLRPISEGDELLTLAVDCDPWNG